MAQLSPAADNKSLTATGSTATITALNTKHCTKLISNVGFPIPPILYIPYNEGP